MVLLVLVAVAMERMPEKKREGADGVVFVLSVVCG